MSEANGMIGRVLAFASDESGATAVEYGLIAALISVAAVLALTNVGSALAELFGNTANTLAISTPSG